MDRYYRPGERIKEYSIIKIIGEGRYGIVYLAKNKYSKKFVIKQLKKDMLKTTRNKLFYEEELLRRLDSPNFPKFIEKFQTKDAEGYVLEYMSGTVFEDLIIRDDYQFTKQEIYEIADKILEIIEVLQKNNMVHRDIRLPNVILQENHELVLIDFGLARYIDNKRYVKEMDYWYLGDFLIHLYYTSYDVTSTSEEKPWYQELDLNPREKLFLKRLMGIRRPYDDIEDIKRDLRRIKMLS